MKKEDEKNAKMEMKMSAKVNYCDCKYRAKKPNKNKNMNYERIKYVPIKLSHLNMQGLGIK